MSGRRRRPANTPEALPRQYEPAQYEPARYEPAPDHGGQHAAPGEVNLGGSTLEFSLPVSDQTGPYPEQGWSGDMYPPAAAPSATGYDASGYGLQAPAPVPPTNVSTDDPTNDVLAWDGGATATVPEPIVVPEHALREPGGVEVEGLTVAVDTAETASVPDHHATTARRGTGRRPGGAGGRELQVEQRPVWFPPGALPAVATAGLAAVLAVAALLGGPAPVAATVVLQAVTAAGWFRLNGMWPARQGIVLAFLAAVAADVAVLAGGDHGLRTLPGVLAVVVMVVLAQQLARRDGRSELLSALTVTASASLVAVLDAAYLLAGDVHAPDLRRGGAVALAALGAAVAVVVAALPLPGPLPAVCGVAAATGAAAAAAAPLGDTGAGPGALLGVGAGVMALMGRRVAGYDRPSRFVHLTAGVALPLALVAPGVYLLARVAAG